MKSCEELLRVYKAFDEINSDGAASSEFPKILDGYNHLDAKLRIIQLFDEVIDEIYATIKNPSSQERRVALLSQLRRTFIAHMHSAKANDLKGSISAQNGSVQISLILDAMLQGNSTKDVSIDRDDFVSKTNELIDDVLESNLPEYPKQILLMKLRAICHISLNEKSYSDHRLRMRIKQIFADFCAEFDDFDRAHEALREKVLRWAKRSVGIGVFALGITADASSLTPLLTHTPGLPSD